MFLVEIKLECSLISEIMKNKFEISYNIKKKLKTFFYRKPFM